MNLDRRLLRETRQATPSLLAVVLCCWLAGVLLVGQAWALSRVVAQVFLEGATLHDVTAGLVAFVTCAAARSALVWSSQVAAQRLAGVIKRDLRVRFAAQLVTLGPAYAQGERSGELVTTALEGIEALDAYFGQYLPQLLNALLVPLTFLLLITPLDPLSGILMAVTAPLIPFFMVLIGSQAEQLTRRQWRALRYLGAHFLDVLQGLITLKVLGRSAEQTETIARISDAYRRRTMAVLRVTFLSALMLEMLATLGTAIIAVEVGLRLLYGGLSFQQAFFVLLLAPEFYMPLRTLGARFHAGVAGATAAQRIYQVLETPHTVPQAETPPPILSPVPAPRRKVLPSIGSVPIRFVNVHFAYEDGTRPALRGVSLDLLPGEKTALVGPSGSGKSTLVQLLLRFIEPHQGSIYVGDVPLTSLDPTWWRTQVAWVPQQPYLLNASIADNIRLGRPDASMEEVIAAACLAHADTFIQELPHGYDTLIGERGARLSGGQAQRIAIARAFLKNTPLLILDEATSSLDAHHEELLQASIAQLMRGRTVLVIAHRLTTTQDADVIWVLSEGRIVEHGRHHELTERRGLYYQLATAYGPMQMTA
ncbi:MAG: thiol reductant ABC exporter subunit CydD [Ardenticatenia bacterium]|jgi:ATP-binding cassette subfamily C protein CydD|nr:MAG: thiol reductant ABC exporter subunit CydD [Ardenticatenia bacterium]